MKKIRKPKVLTIRSKQGKDYIYFYTSKEVKNIVCKIFFFIKDKDAYYIQKIIFNKKDLKRLHKWCVNSLKFMNQNKL